MLSAKWVLRAIMSSCNSPSERCAINVRQAASLLAVFVVSAVLGSSGLGQEVTFRRGDVNGDGVVNLSDAMTTLAVLFQQQGEISCDDAADANDDGALDVSDPIGRSPLSDTSAVQGEEDGRYDVLLVDDFGKLGKTAVASLVGCEAKPAFTMLNRKLFAGDGGSFDLLKAVAAHELMHGIQFSYDVASFCVTDYSTLMEVTASWATEYVYPDINQEHDYVASRWIRSSSTSNLITCPPSTIDTSSRGRS